LHSLLCPTALVPMKEGALVNALDNFDRTPFEDAVQSQVQ
jgi:hypothetical protein